MKINHQITVINKKTKRYSQSNNYEQLLQIHFFFDNSAFAIHSSRWYQVQYLLHCTISSENVSGILQWQLEKEYQIDAFLSLPIREVGKSWK